MGEFRIDISSINNDKLKALAEQANTDKSTVVELNTLNSNEISVWTKSITQGVKDGSLTREDGEMGLAIIKESQQKLQDEISQALVTNPQTQQAKSPEDQRYDELVTLFKNIKDVMEKDQDADIRKTMKKNGGHNFKEYLEALKDGLKRDKKWDATTEKAFKRLEKTVELAAQQQKIEATKQHYAGNADYATEVGYKTGKVAKKWQSVADKKAHANKRDAELSSISREEMEKGLKLTFAGIIPVKKGSTVADKFHYFRKADGTYDLTPIVQGYESVYGVQRYGLKGRSGADATVNWSVDHGKHGSSELNNFQKELQNMTGEKFNEYETKVVVEFLGRFNQKRSHRIDDAFLGDGHRNGDLNAATAITGATLGAVIAPKVVQEQIIKVAKEKAAETAAKLGASAVMVGIDEETGKAMFRMLQEVDLRGLVALGASVGAVVLETGLKALIGTVITEKTCYNISEALGQSHTLKQFEAWVNEEYAGESDKAEALITMAKAYVNEYQDEYKGLHKMQDYINENVVGVGSNGNVDECIGAQLDMAKQNKPVQQTQQTQQTTQTTQTTQTQNADKCADITKESYTLHRQGGYSWGGIVKAFYPCLVEQYGESGAIRRLKKALAGGDQAKFQALLRGKDLPKTMELPKEIDGCEREDNNSIALKKFTAKGNKALVQEVGSEQYRATAREDRTRTATGSNGDNALTNLNNKYKEKYKVCP